MSVGLQPASLLSDHLQVERQEGLILDALERCSCLLRQFEIGMIGYGATSPSPQPSPWGEREHHGPFS